MFFLDSIHRCNMFDLDNGMVAVEVVDKERILEFHDESKRISL